MHDTTTPFPGENGTMTFDLGWERGFRTLTIHGGPFRRYKASMGPNTFGVNLKAEEPGQGEQMYLPIQDYSVPEDIAKTTATVHALLDAMMHGMDVYVGCMGGWGRTGLILSLVAKALGEPDPVAYVRANYTPHAVETAGQKAFVAEFDVTHIQFAIQEKMLKGRWKRWLWSLWSGKKGA